MCVCVYEFVLFVPADHPFLFSSSCFHSSFHSASGFVSIRHCVGWDNHGVVSSGLDRIGLDWIGLVDGIQSFG